MKINLNHEFKDLDGNPIKDSKGQNQLMNKQLGNVIYQSHEKEDPLRFYELAKKIYYSEGEMEYGTSDVEYMKKKINEGFYTGFAGQILEIIANADKK